MSAIYENSSAQTDEGVPETVNTETTHIFENYSVGMGTYQNILYIYFSLMRSYVSLHILTIVLFSI